MPRCYSAFQVQRGLVYRPKRRVCTVMININIDVAELDILIKHRKLQIADAMTIISQNRDCEEIRKAMEIVNKVHEEKLSILVKAWRNQ